MNELIFILYTSAVTLAALAALYLGKEALIGLVCVKVVLMNLFVLEEIKLFSLSATAADALAVGAALTLNLINEYYGRVETERAIKASVFCSLFYMLVSFLHLLYVPAPLDIYYAHFKAVLSVAPRIIIASFISYSIAQKVEAYLYAFLKNSRLKNYFILRNYLSASLTQLLDTVLFSFLGLYGILHNLWQIILVAYTIKLLIIFFSVPLINSLRKFI